MTNFDGDPTLHDDVRQLVSRYGMKAVQEALKSHAKRPAGNRPIGDWLLLADVLRSDALNWLEGRDPWSVRSNKSIATDYSKQHPGQSEPSTHRRIMEKLRRRRNYHALIYAEGIAHKERPFSDYFRALRALCETGILANAWEIRLRLAEQAIATFTEKHGRPANDATMADIEIAVSHIKHYENYIAKIMHNK